jgi:hypothetical protein
LPGSAKFEITGPEKADELRGAVGAMAGSSISSSESTEESEEEEEYEVEDEVEVEEGSEAVSMVLDAKGGESLMYELFDYLCESRMSNFSGMPLRLSR